MDLQQSFQVAGVDGCKAGRLVAVVSVMKESSRADASCVFKLERILVAGTFMDVLSETSDCELVCVDIPIGLSDGQKRRECDVAARKVLGGQRASSVFAAPIRPCLSTNEYKIANAIARKYSSKGLSKQSFFLLEKIRQVDDLMTPALQSRVREIHPEISFRALNSKKAIQQSKKTVPGQAQRHKLLQRIFPDMDDILSKMPTVGFAMDDALDALAAAWTAGQAIIGKVSTSPEKPKLDSKGLKMEILYPSTH